MRGYIAVGHGNEPNGTFDPGAVSPNGVREYDLAYRVVTHLDEALRGKLDYDIEVAGGPGHDPDYRGSVDKIKKGGYDWAIEVHFDEAKAPRGALGLWLTTDDLQWATRILAVYGKRGQAIRGLTQRPNLYFLNATLCPSLIWECDHTDSDITDEECRVAAECIAEGTMLFVSWKWPNLNPTPVNLSPNNSPTNQEDEVQYPIVTTNPFTGQYWVLTGPEGGVDAMGAGGTNEGGVYYGNLIDHPEYNAGEGKALGPAVNIAWTNIGGEGYVIYTRDDAGVLHPYHFNESTIAK